MNTFATDGARDLRNGRSGPRNRCSDHRNRCSGAPESALTCPERLLTISGTGAHDRPESPLTTARNTHTVTFTPEKRDLQLKARLADEAPGILRWAVRGCLEWQQKGLAEPDVVMEATRSYREEMDTLGGFVEERCVVAPGLRGIGLYKAYREWADENGLGVLSAKSFKVRMEERGFRTDGKGRAGLVFDGIGLRV